MERVSVLPSGMRPMMGSNSIDQFSYTYGKLIGANNNLDQKIVNRASVKYIVNTYKALSKFAEQLLATSDPSKQNEFSIKERMQGKTGHIRDKMIGKRKDFTGRSVILIDPELSISECSIPEKMLPTLYSHHLIKAKTKTIKEILDPENFRDIVEEIKRQKLLEKIPVNLNRAPTLHPQSYQSYMVKISRTKAIGVNALVCVAYNADFDGDQMAINIPITDMAVLETIHLMKGPHNLFKVGTGECLLVPRLDMIYGIFMCTRGIYKVTDKPVKSYENNYDVISEDVYNYRIKIWDTVNYMGENMLAGNALMLSSIPTYVDIPLSKFNLDEIDSYLSYWVGLPVDQYRAKLEIIFNLSRRMYADTASDKENDFKELMDFLLAYREFCQDRDRVRLRYFGKELFGEEWESKLKKLLSVINNINNLVNNETARVEPYMSFNSLDEFFKKLKEDTLEKARIKESETGHLDPKQVYLEYKTVISYKGKVGRAGNLILKDELKQNIIPTCNKRTIGTLVDRLLDCTLKEFEESIHKMCLIGFKVAKVYTPTLSVLNNIDRAKLRKPFEEFYEKIEPKRKLYEYGFETDTSYNMTFNMLYKEAEDKIKGILMDLLDEDNGFRLLVESGARGDINNLLQMLSHKGRISKANGEAFSSVITNALLDQLTSLEHMIAAYGSREGLLDKSVKPGETGYLQRLIWHTTGDIIISSEDCHTERGVTYKLSDLIPFEKEDTDPNKQIAKAKQTLRSLIVGRYEAGTNIYIDGEYADRLVEAYNEITIRSPLTCEDPCCAKCFGDDLMIDGHSVVGTPVGIQTGQAIGEPLTQTTMKTFQKGGIAKEIVASSPFDRLQDLIKMIDITDKPDRPSYDPIAWADGIISRENSTTNVGKEIIKILDKDTGKPVKGKILINKGAYLKTEVKRGEGISFSRGDYDMREFIQYNDFDEALKYHALCMFYQCKEDAGLNLKHFEMLTSCMVMYLVTETDNPDLKIGQLYTNTEILKRNTLNTKMVRVLKGVGDVPILRESCVENINMENIQKGFSRAVILGNSDDLDGPIRAMMFGLKPAIGLEANPNYIEDRRRNMRCSY